MNKIKDILGNEAFENLQKGNITSLSSFIITDLNELEDKTNLPQRNILKEALIMASEDIIGDKICLASNYLPKQPPISFGCESIDLVCAGGLPANGICEIVAPSGVGKTQICLQLALQVQLSDNSKEVLPKGAVYISTEGPFPSQRLKQLARIYQEKNTLIFEDNIFVRSITDYGELVKCLEKDLCVLLRNKNIGLIVVDSIAGIYRGEEVDPDYISRSSNILKITTILNRIQDEFGCAIAVTNQVADNPETGTCEPCLGLAWANQVTYRFLLERRNDESPVREFSIEFAPDLPRKTCQFLIREEGIVDYLNEVPISNN